MHLKIWLGVAVMALLAVFILQNTAVVDIRLLFWKVSMSRSLLILLIFSVGFGIGWLLHSFLQHRKPPTEA